MRIQQSSKGMPSSHSKKLLLVGGIGLVSLAILIQFSQKNESEMPKRLSDYHIESVGSTLPSPEFFNTGSRQENV